MPSKLAQDAGSAVVDFVMTSIPVFATLHFMLGFLGLYGTTFTASRATIFESSQLAFADRDNRAGLGFSTACASSAAGALLPTICWHSKLEPTM